MDCIIDIHLSKKFTFYQQNRRYLLACDVLPLNGCATLEYLVEYNLSKFGIHPFENRHFSRRRPAIAVRPARSSGPTDGRTVAGYGQLSLYRRRCPRWLYRRCPVARESRRRASHTPRQCLTLAHHRTRDALSRHVQLSSGRYSNRNIWWVK